MKIFQQLEKPFGHLGIYIRQAYQENWLNSRNFIVLSILIVLSISITTYLLFIAKKFQEYSESFYVFVCAVLYSVCFIIYIWKTIKVFELIVNIETTIQKRKLTNHQFTYNCLIEHGVHKM